MEPVAQYTAGAAHATLTTSQSLAPLLSDAPIPALHHAHLALHYIAALPAQPAPALALPCVSVWPTKNTQAHTHAPSSPPPLPPTKGSKKLMQSDDGREELRQGSFDLDRTAERILEVR